MEQLNIDAAARYLTGKFRSARGVPVFKSSPFTTGPPAAKRPRPPPADESDDLQADTGQFYLFPLSGIFTNLSFTSAAPLVAHPSTPTADWSALKYDVASQSALLHLLDAAAAIDLPPSVAASVTASALRGLSCTLYLGEIRLRLEGFLRV